MYVSILGRQPELSLAELDACFDHPTRFSRSVAGFTAPTPPDVQRLGGSLKVGKQLFTDKTATRWADIEAALIKHCSAQWQTVDHKLTIGLSVYDLPVTAKQLARTALKLKQRLKASGVSVRLIPVSALQLSTATAHHNKLGLSNNKIELLISPFERGVQVATSLGTQNITALARRDQGRPRRDAFVGMLPPKLAQIMINLAGVPGTWTTAPGGTAPTLLDPFCGTGVVLQEAALAGFNVYGSDLAQKMVDYSRENLDWLAATHRTNASIRIEPGDAMTHRWQPPIDAVVCETYLGQPFSAPPSPAKLREVRGNCNHIISSFLKNIAPQLAPDTPLCLAVPAWRTKDGRFTHLPLTQQLESLGFRQLHPGGMPRLMYYRDDQVVARELLVLRKKPASGDLTKHA